MDEFKILGLNLNFEGCLSFEIGIACFLGSTGLISTTFCKLFIGSFLKFKYSSYNFLGTFDGIGSLVLSLAYFATLKVDAGLLSCCSNVGDSDLGIFKSEFFDFLESF